MDEEPNFICSFSGFKFPLSEAVRNWDGQIVHKNFADKRNPQDFVRAVRDNQALRISNPEPQDDFGAIMMEDGDLFAPFYILREDGGKILLE